MKAFDSNDRGNHIEYIVWLRHSDSDLVPIGLLDRFRLLGV